MRAVRVTAFGGPERLEVVALDAPAPGDGVVVEVAAAGLNFSDVLARRGDYPGGPVPPFIAGIEGAGIEVGSGRRVAFVASGAHASRVRVSPERCIEIPAELDLALASALPVTYSTAYHALVTAGRARAGQNVLIHAGAGALGTAAIGVARCLGLRTFATASTAAKRAHIETLGADALDYADIHRVRPDLVVDSVGGSVFRASVRALRPFGRIVVVGASSGDLPVVDVTRVIHHSIAVVGFHLSSLVARPPLARTATAKLMSWIACGQLTPRIAHRFDLAEVADAHRLLESRDSRGKVVLLP